MKKLFILAAATIALASCGNKTNENNGGADSAAVTADSASTVQDTDGNSAEEIAQTLNEQLNAKDAKSLETTLAAAKAQYEALVKAGKTKEAVQYASKLKEFYDKNAETIKAVATGNTTINDLVNGIANLPTDADNATQALKGAAQSDANAAVNGVKDAANNAKQTIKNAENNAKQTVKDAENNARQSVKNAKKNAEDKAKNAVNNAKQKTRDAANKAVNDALNKAFGN